MCSTNFLWSCKTKLVAKYICLFIISCVFDCAVFSSIVAEHAGRDWWCYAGDPSSAFAALSHTAELRKHGWMCRNEALFYMRYLLWILSSRSPKLYGFCVYFLTFLSLRLLLELLTYLRVSILHRTIAGFIHPSLFKNMF